MTEPSCVLRTDYRHGSECRQPALYRVYGVGCYVCIDVGFCDGCIGHLVCADHAAKLRTESVAQVPARSGKTVPAFVVERIHSLATDAAWLDALFAEPERELASLPAWARPVVTPAGQLSGISGSGGPTTDDGPTTGGDA